MFCMDVDEVPHTPLNDDNWNRNCHVGVPNIQSADVTRMQFKWTALECYFLNSMSNILILVWQKITGYELKYTALVGKPSEITYHHSEHVLQTLARQIGLPGIRRMYCIG